MNMESLSGKTALVTGGAGGIGRAISLHLAAAGARVLILCRDTRKAETTLENIAENGGEAYCHIADLEDLEGIPDVMNALSADHPPVDILVNNAAISGFMGPVADTPPEELDKILRVNLMAPFHLARLVLPGMTAQHYGRIINISSVAPRINPPNSATYNISKAGLNALTVSLSREAAVSGVTVNALAPGLVLTDRIKNARLPGLASETGQTPDQLLAAMTARTDTRRLTTEDEVAKTVLFLCGPAARNITGEIIEMSGGY